MLFRGEQAIEPSTPIEMSFVLPGKVCHELPALVLCSGRVVRHVKPSTDEGLSLASASWVIASSGGHPACIKSGGKE